jgi:hypothetical protein
VKLGHGGISYIGRVLNCDYPTIKTGMQELSDKTALNEVCIRRPGGGRKAALKVSVTVIDQWLAKHHFRRRQAQKMRATGSHPQRNAQFENIQRLQQQYQAAGNPVLSGDADSL